MFRTEQKVLSPKSLKFEQINVDQMVNEMYDMFNIE